MGGDTSHENTGDVVADFYDRHPYPPAPRGLDSYDAAADDSMRRRAEFHLLFPGDPYRDDLDVLVAGCGTSQAARHAARRPRSRVVGIDVSPASLHATQALKDRYDLHNLELHELPIERLDELGASFDLVICTGVIHHLADPDRGLRSLRSVLRPAGAIHLMVYATLGRHGVTIMQEYATRVGVEPSRSDVTDLARLLMMVPADHPIVPVLRSSADFRSPDGLADALLNPRERTYRVEELLGALDDATLSFGRWYRQAPYLPQCGFPAAGPHRARLESLPVRQQYAALELLRGSMTRHSVIAHHASAPRNGSLPVDAQWDRSIPIRLPNTIVVEERLPAGAAAVLINRDHSFGDIVLPVTETERRLFAAVDGTRSIASVMTAAGVDDRSLGRRLFTRLWRYDQVVFDTSDSHP